MEASIIEPPDKSYVSSKANHIVLEYLKFGQLLHFKTTYLPNSCYKYFLFS